MHECSPKIRMSDSKLHQLCKERCCISNEQFQSVEILENRQGGCKLPATPGFTCLVMVSMYRKIASPEEVNPFLYGAQH